MLVYEIDKCKDGHYDIMAVDADEGTRIVWAVRDTLREAKELKTVLEST